MTASAPLNLGLFRVHRIFSFAFFGIAILMLAAGVAILVQDRRAVGLALYSVVSRLLVWLIGMAPRVLEMARGMAGFFPAHSACCGCLASP